MIEHAVLPSPMSSLRRQQVLSNGVLGMTIFVIAETMLFSGLISAFVIAKSNQVAWPPVGQPRLPVAETAFNTTALLVSGVFLFLAARAFSRDVSRARSQVVEIENPAASARTPLLIAILLGAFFVVFQGGEWIALLSEGLTTRQVWSGASSEATTLIVASPLVGGAVVESSPTTSDAT